MKKLNNKGFAISTVIYAVLIIAVLIMGMLLSTMVFSKKTTDDLVYSVEKDLNSHIEEQDIKISSKICKRAKTLHSETCTSSSTTGYCTAGGTSITYGQLGNTGVLTSGDAFDCDVNGDGNYDPETERFYYVTDLESDTNIAVLVFYTNASPEGTRSRGTRPPYHSSNSYSGPRDAASMLPTTTAWPKATLYNKTSQIYNEDGGTTVIISTSTTTIENLPIFTYSDTVAARLLTYKEFRQMSDTAKNTFLQDLGGSHPTDWPSCIWLNTAYQRGGGIYGQVYAIYSPARETIAVRQYTPNQSCGVRPVIEVKKTDIDY